MYKGLNGKTILITGSSRGIGKATAQLAHEAGARVILHGQIDSPHLKTQSKALNAPYIVCDIADKKAVFGQIAVLMGGASTSTC